MSHPHVHNLHINSDAYIVKKWPGVRMKIDWLFEQMVSGYLLPANPSVLATSPLYFDNKWFRQIKSETNKYASSNFTADTMREIYLSFTMIQHMSLVKKPEITVFFSTAALLFCSRPNVIKLECNRFQQILRYLHVNDNWTYMYVPSGPSDCFFAQNSTCFWWAFRM